MQVLRDFDVDQPVRRRSPTRWACVLFALAMVALWRRPALSHPDGAAPGPRPEHHARRVHAVRGLWLLWVFGVMKAFWLLAGRGRPARRGRASSTGRWTMSSPRPARAESEGAAQRARGGARARHPGVPDHRRHLAAGLGLGHRPRHPDRRATPRPPGCCAALFNAHPDPAGRRLRLARRPHPHRPAHPRQQRSTTTAPTPTRPAAARACARCCRSCATSCSSSSW